MFFVLINLGVYAQQNSISNEVLLGNKGMTYQGFVQFSTHEKIRFTHNYFLDKPYSNQQQNLYFLRSNLEYSLRANVQLLLSVGVKNPGVFYSSTLQLKQLGNRSSTFFLLGATLINRPVLEITFIHNYTVAQWKESKLIFRLFGTFSIDKDGFTRGIQQMRIGMQQNHFRWGVGLNMDQFAKLSMPRFNHGVFFMYQIKQ